MIHRDSSRTAGWTMSSLPLLRNALAPLSPLRRSQELSIDACYEDVMYKKLEYRFLVLSHFDYISGK